MLQASFFPVSFYLFLYYFYCSSLQLHSLNHVPISFEASFLPSALFSFNIFIFSLPSFKVFIFLSGSFPQCTQENKHKCHFYGILKIPWRQDACQLSAKPHRRNTSFLSRLRYWKNTWKKICLFFPPDFLLFLYFPVKDLDAHFP